jgi:hypothetical protein
MKVDTSQTHVGDQGPMAGILPTLELGGTHDISCRHNPGRNYVGRPLRTRDVDHLTLEGRQPRSRP